MSTSKRGTRGRLPAARGASGKTPARDDFKCVVKDCEEIIRGDRISGHFQEKSKLDVLDDAKKMDVSGEVVNGLRHINSMCIDDENQRKHTIYLLNNGYSSKKLPGMKDEGFKKRKDVNFTGAFSSSGFKVFYFILLYLDFEYFRAFLSRKKFTFGCKSVFLY